MFSNSLIYMFLLFPETTVIHVLVSIILFWRLERWSTLSQTLPPKTDDLTLIPQTMDLIPTTFWIMDLTTPGRTR